MLIDLRKLLSGTKDEEMISADIDMSVIDTGYAKYDIIDKDSVDLTIQKIDDEKLQIIGKGHVALNIPCDRCLEPVRTDISFDIDKDISFEDGLSGVEDEEQDYIDGYNLDVDKLVFGEILIAIPSKTLCREDCKGLCPKCGANLNVSDCGCDRESLDPRMSVFKDILNNFKEV